MGQTRKLNLPERLTFFMNPRSPNHKNFQRYVQGLNEESVQICCLPTSGCDTLWIRKKEGTILNTLYGPTAIDYYFSNIRIK